MALGTDNMEMMAFQSVQFETAAAKNQSAHAKHQDFSREKLPSREVLRLCGLVIARS
jgi:hypothetical protein